MAEKGNFWIINKKIKTLDRNNIKFITFYYLRSKTILFCDFKKSLHQNGPKTKVRPKTGKPSKYL